MQIKIFSPLAHTHTQQNNKSKFFKPVSNPGKDLPMPIGPISSGSLVFTNLYPDVFSSSKNDSLLVEQKKELNIIEK